MQFHFATVGVFFLLAITFVLLMLTLGKFLRPQNPEPLKLTTYECGEPHTGSAWLNFNIRFYVVALIFLVFEVEIAFMLPVALVFRRWVTEGRGLYAFAEILMFLGILVVGLVYVWAKGDFDWLKRVTPAEADDDQPMKEAA
jgi:NADH-quinone oxidoreductase subunit A